MPKYLYCVTKGNNQNYDTLAGLDGAPLQTVSAHGITCVVSDTQITDKEINYQSAITHEKVLEAIMDRETIIPISFGHIVHTDDEIKEKLLEKHKSILEQHLNSLEGKIELSLKALWLDIKQVFEDISKNSAEIQKIKAKHKITRDDQIRAGEIASKQLIALREDTQQRAESYFKDVSLEVKRSKIFGDQMIANLAFLVSREDLKKFDQKVNAYDDITGENIRLKYTGPVPPFNFVDLKLQF